MFFKKIFMPKNNELKEVEAVKMWKVSWGLDDYYNKANANLQAEFFTSHELASQYKQSIEEAVKLLRYKGQYFIKLTEEE